MVTGPQPVVHARALTCPNCGGNVELRGFAHTRSAVCIQCLSILDASTPEVTILQRFDERTRVQPLIPLGKRGKIRNTLYEVIGFQVRTVTIGGTDYSWHEYLLFNPYEGFRYLTVYNGHWNDVRTLPEVPLFTTAGGRKAVVHRGITFRHFQTALATTTFVMGEFPWQVRTGEQVQTEDFIAPPLMLSAETTEDEVTWSRSEYIEGAAVWQAFQLPGAPPPAQGVFANQPAPQTSGGSLWGVFFKFFLIWLALLAGLRFLSQNKQVYDSALQLANGQQVITGTFDLPGRTSNAAIEIRTEGSGYYHLGLVNQGTGRAIEFARNVGAQDTVIVPNVAAGRYYLRIDPEIDAGRKFMGRISVRRDVPQTFWIWLALPFLLIPPVLESMRGGNFEARRWQESDYAQ